SGNAAAIYLFSAALYCNGYEVTVTSVWNASLSNYVKSFQDNMQLTDNGEGDPNTWMALLISCGNTDRSSNGCDTRFEMTDERLATLKANGYEVVGRYLTGGDFKQLRPDEPARIINAGMKFFPIFQESGTDISYFTADQGKADATSAASAAWGFDIPADNIIYFAVDMDPTDTQITNSILPYFEAVSGNMGSAYKVGVYGTRNVCTQVCGKNYATTSFVSDMSYGFSGNMGFKMPTDWNFDQFHEISSADSGWDFDLDKTTYSGKFPVVTVVNAAQAATYTRPAITPLAAGTPTIQSFIQDFATLEDLYVAYYNAFIAVVGAPITASVLASAIANFLRSQAYTGTEWKLMTDKDADLNFVSYVQAQNVDLYNRIYPYIQGTAERPLLSDGANGQIDLGHLAATMEGYFNIGEPPQFWGGWGGDLATGMRDVTRNYADGKSTEPDYAGKTLQEVANATIGAEDSSCNYSDLCSDFDAYALVQRIKTNTDQGHPFSEAVSWYYGSQVSTRFQQIFTELNCAKNLPDLHLSIFSNMSLGMLENVPKYGLLASKAGNPTMAVQYASCYSLAEYIMSMQ
ncbi:MAG TPA: hypothetical protein DEP42_00360, partial [Ruminococcaceae bacterium]|nr:hypothetical protein [Oscillospiraceae bacterium]